MGIIGIERRFLTEIEPKSTFRVGSLGNLQDIHEAVGIIEEGGIVACQMRGVFGMWMRGDNIDTVRSSLEVKGDKLDKSLSTMMPAREFLPLIDKKLIPTEIRYLVENSDLFRERLGSVCHVRAPIRIDLARHIPSSLLSGENGRYYMHNLDPYGHWPMTSMVKSLNEEGIKFIAVTSLNDHSIGESEISDFERAIEFSYNAPSISLLLADPTNRREDLKGSFAIIDLERLSALRDGHIPVEVIESILEVELDKTNMKPSNYPAVDFSPILGLEIGPEAFRANVLVFLKGNLVFTNQ